MVGHIASLFLGQEVRPIVLLDGDDAGRVRRDALMKELYSAHGSAILMLDEALGRNGEHLEIEDILGKDIILPVISALINKELKLDETNRNVGSLPNKIKAAAGQQSIDLPEGWKASVAIKLVSEWAENRTVLPSSVLDTASQLFNMIRNRFEQAI